MGWSGRAPAPPASEAGKGRPRQGACHVSETQLSDRRDRHRYRQELVPHRGPRRLGSIAGRSLPPFADEQSGPAELSQRATLVLHFGPAATTNSAESVTFDFIELEMKHSASSPIR